jgi:hypothetical protein
MSAYGHSHLSDWMFGGVTRTVLCECRHVHESLQSFVAISAEHLLPQQVFLLLVVSLLPPKQKCYPQRLVNKLS